MLKLVQTGLALALALLLGAACATPDSPPRASEAAAPQRTRLPGTRVSLEVPEGFELTAAIAGLTNSSGFSTLTVSEIEAPLRETLANLGELQAAELEARPLGDYAGFITEVTEPYQGQSFTRLRWVFGDERSAVMIDAFSTSEHAELELPILRRVLDSVRWDPSLELPPFDGRTFRLNDLAGWKFAGRDEAKLMFSAEGRADRTRPWFIATPSRESITLSRRLYTKTSFSQVAAYARDASYGRLKRGAIEPIEIDGLRGFTSISTAEHRDLDLPSVFYNLVLFEGDSSWIFQGVAPESEREQWIPIFERMARSFERLRRPLRTRTGRCEVSVPRSWKVLSAQREGDELFAACLYGGCRIEIGTTPRSSLAPGLPLREHSEAQSAGLVREGTWVTELTAVEVAGQAALRREFRAELEGDSRHVITIWIEDPESFHLVVASYPSEAEEWSRPEVERVLASFRVLEATDR